MIKTKEVNECVKMVKRENAYEVWEGKLWGEKATWYVLKKYQKPSLEAKNPYARWFCLVVTPMTGPSGEMGDVYVREIKGFASKVS